MTIEVSGVLMSWETFVISSVFSRSLFMRSDTALFRPSVMLLRLSACSFKGPYILSVSTLLLKFPPAISFPAARSLFMHKSVYSVSTTRTNRSRSHPISTSPLPKAAIQINSTNRMPATISPAFGMSGRFFSTSRAMPRGFLMSRTSHAHTRHTRQLLSVSRSFMCTAKSMHQTMNIRLPAMTNAAHSARPGTSAL